MYAFGPLPKQKRSGHMIGTHQKIDRVARRHLGEMILHSENADKFPSIGDILHFEGTRGPDGIKMKSPGRDEPWHFIDPREPEGVLLDYISDHHDNLVAALRSGNTTRAAFEAAWLAHAVSDGLTPAHHDPYEEQTKHMRTDDQVKLGKFRSRMVMSGGGSSKDFIRHNWQYWGAKGVLTTHALFEAGVAMAAKPFRFHSGMPSEHDIEVLLEDGFEHTYVRLVKEIASLEMYESFKRTGWTSTLARQTNKELLPRVVMAVTLAWFEAYREAFDEEPQ